MTTERLVVDTNELIRAALRPSGSPRAILDALRASDGILLFSDETFEELRTRILLPKFDRYVRSDARAVFLAQLEAVSAWVSIVGATLGCRDHNDDKFLETALQGEADSLVTGDADLLVLSPFQGIPILTPAADAQCVMP